MAYDKKALSGNIGVGATVPTLFKYNTDDDFNLVQSAGYFNEADDILEVNDVIYAQTSDGFTILRVTQVATRPLTVSVADVEV